VFEQAVLAGRSAALALNKEVEFEVRGQDLKLDEKLSEVIRDALVHLVRNAVHHGIEKSGKILIEVANRDGQTRITVTDNGRGIDPTLIQQIFKPGFSTASEISEISGRGVGLDVVKTGIEEAGGSITVTSRIGHGSTFEITLPSDPNPR
jgi:two-component system chemotaxis sensor kinase CheA